MDIRIVILQRGWVFVGRYCRSGDERWLENAYCIRIWGTTKGLSELKDGPTAKTVLDPAGRVDFHMLTEVATIKCDPKKWESVCVA